jgi:alpha-tubulin suppressor-like RCC1 family protein
MVTGLVGSGLVLRNNGGDDLSVTADGPVVFATPLASGASYSVTVLTQPTSPAQTCVVTEGSGTMSGANVTTVAIVCTTNSYAVGGTITGLAGSGLVLRNNGGDDLAVSANGSFTFATPLASGAAYSVTVLTQPTNPTQTCVVTGGTGTVASANVTTVAIVCTTNTHTVGGTVTGLAGSGLVLRNNGGDDLAVSSDGAFTFPSALGDGAFYRVSVLTHPTHPVQGCVVTGGNGTTSVGNVTDVVVTCTTVSSSGLVFATVSSDGSNSCGLTTTGAAYCWGDNRFGGLGDGTTTNSSIPVAVKGGLTFQMVSAGGYFACGVTTGGAAYCWGLNDEGELGDGTTTSSATPVDVIGGLSFATLSAGIWHTCGVTTAGAAYCWGSNYHGELGDGTTDNSAAPVAVAGGHTFATLNAGGYSSCGVTTGGDAYCWGWNVDGELGDGTDWPQVMRSTPVAVLGGSRFTTVIASWWSSCGLTAAGVAYCWGGNSGGLEQCTDYVAGGYGQTRSVACNRRPQPLDGGLTFVALADDEGNCGISTTGTAYCWGSTPVALEGGHTFAAISSTCGVTTAGVAYCWGDNQYGQLGDGTTTSSSVPVKVAGQP